MPTSSDTMVLQCVIMKPKEKYLPKKKKKNEDNVYIEKETFL